jgi:branched-chain amino acid transport system permease protein
MSAAAKTATVDRRFSVTVASKANFAVLGFGIVVLVVLIVFPFFAGTPWTRRLVDFFTLLALAQFWNLMLGYAGLISVGQQGYIGIGSYTLWLFADVLHIHPFISVIFAAIGGAVIALPAATLVFRLRGGYLAIGTWVIAEVLRLIVANIKRTGGGSGITIQAATKLGTEIRVPGSYWWGLGLAVAAMAITYFLLRSRTGLALKSIRDNDLAAESSGVNLWRTKLYTYIIAGAGCAAVGAIVAIHLLRVQPAAAFSINWTAYLIFITVIGGVGTIEGPIIGTIIYFVLRETTSKYGEWYFIVLGVLAIVVTIWSPQGIYGFIARKTNFFVFPLQRKIKWLQGEPEGGAGE